MRNGPRFQLFLCCSQLSGKRGQATALNRVGFSDTFGNVIMPNIRETAPVQICMRRRSTGQYGIPTAILSQVG